MYIPMLWALFSKRHSGMSVLTVTLICLAVNSFFKWSGVYPLNQGQSQALGALLPLLLMGLYEFYATKTKPISIQYVQYEEGRLQREQSGEDVAANREAIDEARRENRHGIGVIGLGILSIGSLIAILGALADQGTALVSGMGILVGLIGVSVIRMRGPNVS